MGLLGVTICQTSIVMPVTSLRSLFTIESILLPKVTNPFTQTHNPIVHDSSLFDSQ